ncbi:hypothetical protein AR679_gp014 [Yellowstone lake phycodnavirus 1]|uniref:hypothetical protein n=1 Tax=Yellowstone lake phycodnavirus 1 TaxID=1586713 RepID=UPI0006EB7A4B|nr:hypothetical protein AR679_gp014 [Yellowstone lake phycodnavirus 1]BAT22040.1 hypothetical protein [Yellowstone lake phycodnavirus 1]
MRLAKCTVRVHKAVEGVVVDRLRLLHRLCRCGIRALVGRSAAAQVPLAEALALERRKLARLLLGRYALAFAVTRGLRFCLIALFVFAWHLDSSLANLLIKVVQVFVRKAKVSRHALHENLVAISNQGTDRLGELHFVLPLTCINLLSRAHNLDFRDGHGVIILLFIKY